MVLRKIKNKLTSLSLLSLSFIGCCPKGVIGYVINETYTFNYKGQERKICLFIDEEKEYFLWSYVATPEDAINYSQFFDFLFYGRDNFKSQTDFEYTHDGKTIELTYSEEKEKYVYPFEGSVDIYISYKNSKESIKEDIEKKYYSIDCMGMEWFT